MDPPTSSSRVNTVNVSSKKSEQASGMTSEGPVPQRPRSSVALMLFASGLMGALLYFARACVYPSCAGGAVRIAALESC